MIKLIGGSDGGQGSIREGDSTVNPFLQMRYFSAPSSVGVRIQAISKRFVCQLPFDVELSRVGEKIRNRVMVQLSLSSHH